MYNSWLLGLAIFGVVGRCWEHTAGNELDGLIGKEEHVLVAYVAPETEPCKALEPEWEYITPIPDTPLLSIDCTLSPKICAAHDVVSLPAIRLYHGSIDSMTRYRGERTSQAISSFVPRALRPVITPLTPSNVTAFHTADSIVFVAYIPASKPALQALYTAAAEKYRYSYTFGKLTSKGQITRIECWKNGGDVMTWEISEEPGVLQRWIEDVSRPVVGRLSRKNEMEYLTSGKSLFYIFSPYSTISALQTSFASLAKRYIEYVLFLVVDVKEFGNMLGQMGLEGKSFPCAALYNPRMDQIFTFGGEGENVEPVGMEEWIGAISRGEVKALGQEEGEVGGEESYEEKEHGDGHDEL